VPQMLSRAAVSRQQLTARHAARCRQCCIQNAATAVPRQLHLATLAGNTLEHQQPQARRHRRRVAVAAAAAGSDSAGGDADMEAAARGEISEESEQHPPYSACHTLCCRPFHSVANALQPWRLACWRCNHVSLYTPSSAERMRVCMPPVMDRINKATQVIGTMIAEVSKDVFVADPSGEQLSGLASLLPPVVCQTPADHSQD
jgi:hypothetical protein